MWFRDGDHSSVFFYSLIKQRRKDSQIHLLVNETRHVLNEQSQVVNSIVGFYTSLLGIAQSRVYIDEVVIFRGPILNSSMHDWLERSVTLEEVKVPDGFNVFFYKNAWNFIGTDVVGGI